MKKEYPMPHGKPANKLWASLNKPVFQPSGSPAPRLHRRARDLMSISSLMAFFVAGWWLLIAGCIVVVARSPVSSPDSSARNLLEHWHLLPAGHVDFRLLLLAWVLGFASAMAPLICLRRLGKALLAQVPLSFTVASRFRWLGHALISNILVGLLSSVLAVSQIPQYQLSLTMGFWGTFTAALLAYVMADLVHDGARAAEENREFV